MRISAKADYAVRAAVELAAADDEKPVKAERIAIAQEIPLNFLENILGELRHARIRHSRDTNVRLIWRGMSVYARARQNPEQTRLPHMRQPDDPCLHKFRILT